MAYPACFQSSIEFICSVQASSLEWNTFLKAQGNIGRFSETRGLGKILVNLPRKRHCAGQAWHSNELSDACRSPRMENSSLTASPL